MVDITGQISFEEFLKSDFKPEALKQETEIEYLNPMSDDLSKLRLCKSDLLRICNVLCDYNDMLREKIDNAECSPYMIAEWEYIISKLDGVYHKIADPMGYDREKAIKKMHKKMGKENDIGEDGMALAVKGKKNLE